MEMSCQTAGSFYGLHADKGKVMPLQARTPKRKDDRLTLNSRQIVVDDTTGKWLVSLPRRKLERKLANKNPSKGMKFLFLWIGTVLPKLTLASHAWNC